MTNGGYQPKDTGAPTKPPRNFCTAGRKEPASRYGDVAARHGDLKMFIDGEWHMVLATTPKKWVLAIKDDSEPVPFGQKALPIVFTTRQDAENAAKLRCDVVAVEAA